jgi:hypothetical protein
MLRRTILALAVAAALRSSTAAASPTPGRAWLRMETTACLGTCPEFTLTVYEDGEVAFDGHHCVIRRGLNRRRLSAESLQALHQQVADSGFWRLAADCCNHRDVTDAPWTYLEIAAEGDVSKRIEHYHGCRTAPAQLHALEQEILSATGATRWIGTEKQRDAKKWRRNRCGTRSLSAPPSTSSMSLTDGFAGLTRPWRRRRSPPALAPRGGG